MKAEDNLLWPAEAKEEVQPEAQVLHPESASEVGDVRGAFDVPPTIEDRPRPSEKHKFKKHG
jgi:hypothetical protein